MYTCDVIACRYVVYTLCCVHAEVNTRHYTHVSHAGELTDIVKQLKDVPVFVVGKATAAAGVIVGYP